MKNRAKILATASVLAVGVGLSACASGEPIGLAFEPKGIVGVELADTGLPELPPPGRGCSWERTLNNLSYEIP